MDHFFSMKKVRELEDRVRVHVEKSRKVLEKAGETGEKVNLLYLMSAMTMGEYLRSCIVRTTGLRDDT